MQILKVVAVRAAASALLAFALLSGAYALPVKAAPQSFDIGPQGLASALNEFARQSHEQLLFAPEVVARKSSRGVHGSMEPIAALRILLEDSGLSYSTTPGGAILIGEAHQAQTEATKTEEGAKEVGKSSSSQTFRLAQVDQATAGSTAVSEERNHQKTPVLEEVVVTGSRISTASGQRTLPVHVYNREDIDRSGQSTTADFLHTLPGVSSFQNAIFDGASGFPGMANVQLHGLPVGTTLTLLNGQRLETSTYGFFDLGNIPLAAVDRIEILPVGASAIYGADALAGAVNLILRKNFDGLEVDATSNHGVGVTGTGASVAWGENLDKGSVSLIASVQDQGELLGTQREPTSSHRFPGDHSLIPAIAIFECAPGNVYSVDGSNLPGLSAPMAGIPAGVSGIPATQQFVSSAGKPNVCNLSQFQDITPHSRNESAVLTAHYNTTERSELFTDVLIAHRAVRAQVGPQFAVFEFSGTPLGAANPYNPFGVPVNVDFAYNGTGQQYYESMSWIRPLVGIRGSVFSDWHYEVTADWSSDRLSVSQLITDPQKLNDALDSSDSATALNPFSSGAPGSPQLLSSLTPSVNAVDLHEHDQFIGGQGILRGPIAHLPAGDIQTAIGSEYQHESQENSFIGFGGVSFPPLNLQRTAYAAFAEARAPLLGHRTAGASEERVALTLAGRYDHSGDYGGKATWQSGLLWRTNEVLAVTGGYGTSYQAPQLLQVAGPQITTPGGSLGGAPAIDPYRGSTPVDYPLTIVNGANPNLKPETGSAITFGLEYSHRTSEGLHASLSWYDLKITNYIGQLPNQVIISNPDLFPGAIVRAPPTPQDQQLGYLGVITRFNQVNYNFGDLSVTGVDADIRYAINTRFGQFTPSIALSNIYRWQSALLPGAASIDGVSKATLFGVGWAPRWKGTAALAWARGPLSANLAGRYIGRYEDYQDLLGPNTNMVGNTWIFDVNARWEAGKAVAVSSRWFAGSYIGLGAVNLFNRTPPYSNTGAWYDYHEYDARGRYVYLNVGIRP